ncbi:PREDICTED: G-protein coupled receptor 4-like [Poecilia mexicana]|uniref:G-protein coupled receptor 4-like n=1 Tax=Poecilia mexicana TaxID=48701 RepID=UPI00072DCFCA|nr:PREDICTED: G-protein coupled receptor 4-like [Poecilia mexicana]XP_014841870.1 PREDICTED: G-protein coupled receptor 4-like [Poecilia mexicana]
MEGFDLNISGLYVSRGFTNFSSDKTLYENCKHIPEVLIWYLSLQFTNMFVGIPANITVLWLIHKSKRDSSTSDIFIVHLAVLDVLFCLTPPLELACIVFLTASSPWYILRFFYGIKDFSPLFLSCICLDRYIAVIHPIFFTRLKDRQHRPALAIVVWLIILAYASAKCPGNIPGFEQVYTMMILTVFAFMVFCNMVILWALRRSRPGRDSKHPVKKRAFNMVLIILAIIVFNYFPSVALFPFKGYFSEDIFRCYIHHVAFGLMDFSSTIQPMLYLSKEKFPWRLDCCRTTTKETQTNSDSREIWNVTQHSQYVSEGNL